MRFGAPEAPPPIDEIETSVPVEEGMRRIIPQENPGISTGGALQDLGAETSALAQRVQHTDASAYVGPTLAKLRVAAEQHLLNTQPADVQKAGGFTPAVMSGFQKDADAAVNAAPNPLAAQMLRQGLAGIGADLNIRAMRQDAQARMAQRATGALTAAAQAATAVELNPDSWQAAGAEQIHTIQGLGLDPVTTARLSREADVTLSEAAGRGYAKRDPLGTLNRLNNPTDPLFAGMSPQSRDAITTYSQGQLVSQKAAGIIEQYRTGGQQAGTQALAGIDNDTSIPVNLRDEVRAQVNGGVAQLRQDAREQHADGITQLEENIAKGQAGSQDRVAAWSLFHANALDTSELASTLASIDHSEVKQARATVAISAVQDAYTTGKPLDPKDTRSTKAADQFFTTRLAAGLQPGSAAYANATTQFATRTGIVPRSALSWARANLTAGDPQSAAQSADLIARLESANPRALGFAVDPRTKAIADSVSAAVKAGTPAQMAVEMARQNANLSPAEQTTLEQKWRTLKADTSQGGALTELLKSDPTFKGGWFQGLPAVPTALQGDFDSLTKEYFRYTGGNLDQSRELALRDLKRVWGVSQVNGKRELMPYAPEAAFPGLTAPEVRTDLAQTVSDNANALRSINPGTGQLETYRPDPSTLRLIPTDRTARTSGLDWNVGAPDQWGAMDLLRGADGSPLTYRLPVSRTDFDRVHAEMDAAGIAKARELQAQRQKSLALAQHEERESLAVLGR